MKDLRHSLAVATDREVISRSVITAFVVGGILIVIDHGGEIAGGRLDAPMAVHMALTLLVPYLVATITIGAAVGQRRQHRGGQDPLLLEREIRAIRRFPDHNPNPVMRVDRSGRLLYANRSSAPIREALGVSVGDALDADLTRRLREAATATPPQTVEVRYQNQTFALLPVEVPEFDVLNVYGTDITAAKAIDRFPGGNPNPVLRMSPEGVLLYANEASRSLIAALGLRLGAPFPAELKEQLAVPIGAGAAGSPVAEVAADGHTYALKSVLIEEFGFINIYGTDITAVKAMNKFPDQNPNPVLRVTPDGRLQYANPSSARVLKGLGIQVGDELPADLMRKVLELAEHGAPTERLEVWGDHHVYELLVVEVYEFGFINLYGTDVTAARQVKKANEENERLLLNILPPSIARRLKAGESPIADRFEEMTVMFTDVVGFTPLSAGLTAIEVVDLLNAIFRIFDELADRYELEKIKTIGDAYMVVGNLDRARGDDPERMAAMGLEMMERISRFGDNEGHTITIRAGMHVGPAAAGVIGLKKFIYDVWGDTVNTASRMESHGVPGRVQVTEETYRRLERSFVFEPRGVVDVKGKGPVQTYLLVAPRGSP